MDIKVWVAVIGAIGTIAASYVAADHKVQQAAGQQEQQIRQAQEGTTARLNNVIASTPGPLETGQKLCRVLRGTSWRDGLIVPQNWTVSLCVDYMKKSGGTGYQLGCIYPDGTNLAKEDGSFPSPNCGWK